MKRDIVSTGPFCPLGGPTSALSVTCHAPPQALSHAVSCVHHRALMFTLLWPLATFKIPFWLFSTVVHMCSSSIWYLFYLMVSIVLVTLDCLPLILKILWLWFKMISVSSALYIFRTLTVSILYDLKTSYFAFLVFHSIFNIILFPFLFINFNSGLCI